MSLQIPTEWSVQLDEDCRIFFATEDQARRFYDMTVAEWDAEVPIGWDAIAATLGLVYGEDFAMVTLPPVLQSDCRMNNIPTQLAGCAPSPGRSSHPPGGHL